VLAIAVFWTFSAYPGGNLYIAFGIGYLCGLLAAIGIGMLSTTMPRSGGDYILNGRTIHPLVGLISSFWFTVNVLVSIAFITETLIVGALAPSFVAAGAIGHHPTLVDWGTTLESSKSWLFVAGIIALVGCSLPTAKIRVHRAHERLRDTLQGACDFHFDDRGVLVCGKKPPEPQAPIPHG
jgi:amino acid transporter